MADSLDKSAIAVAVLIPQPLPGPYDYSIPDGMAITVGTFVEVPLGRRTVRGVVWGPAQGDVDPGKLRPIDRVIDCPTLPDESRSLVDWTASYTMSPPGSVLRMAMSVPDALDPPPPTVLFRSAEPATEHERLTSARRRVLEVLSDGKALTAKDLAAEAACGSSVIKGMEKIGLVERFELPHRPSAEPPAHDRGGPSLTADQDKAASAILAAVGEGGFSPFLLDGVAGSGKTEVYFEAIGAALKQGRQVLVLVPEIALSAQWLSRFANRFGVRPVEWHSGVTSARRRKAWRSLIEGGAQVVVGARSALFLPFVDLGLIVVDEEHEAAFKQEDGVVYNARDMAVVRASIAEAPIVLASATPSLESLVNAQRGRYRHLVLPARVGKSVMPETMAIDLRESPPPRQEFLSPPLREALADTLDRGEQSLLFLNRRGYAPLTLCRNCGHRFECQNCSAWLVEHRLAGRLRCHHCGYSAPRPTICPSCGAEDSLAACGPGVERIAEEVMAQLPDARLELMTSDAVHNPVRARELIDRITAREIDILIGTQIVAKGYHFPYLTFVGVVDADLGQNGGDPRAAERTFQLLTQVAGRAGREERPGKVLLQTYNPEAEVIAALLAGDRKAFMDQQIAMRRHAGLPPFGRLASLILSSPASPLLHDFGRSLAQAIPSSKHCQVLGPSEAPLARLRGRFRTRFLVQATKGAEIQRFIADWLGSVKVPSAIRLSIDIDPYSFY